MALITGCLLAAVPSFAQHPQVVNSVLLDANSGFVGFDSAGNAVEDGSGYGQSVLTKFTPTGTVLSRVPLLQSAVSATIDANGNLYVLEPSCSSGCPAPTTTFGTGTNGILFGKVNSTGDAFVWLDKLTDAGAAGIQVDSAGNVYLAGGADCSSPTTPGSYQPQCAPNGSSPGYAAKIDSTGTKLLYATFLRGTTQNYETVDAFAVDGLGNLYVVGTAQADWPTTPGAFETTATCPSGVICPNFLAKLSSDGATLAYSTFLDEGVPSVIAVDGQGSAYVGGATADPSFPTTPGAAETTFPSWPSLNGTPYPGFVMKFKPDGSGLIYSTYIYVLDTTTWNAGLPRSLSLDSAGDAYLAGLTRRPDAPTANAIQATDNHPNEGEGAIAELNSQGSGFVFSTYLGGPGGAASDNSVWQVMVATDGSVHVAGYTVGNEFPALASLDSSYPYNPVLYIMTLEPNGTSAAPIMYNTESITAAAPGALQDSVGNACAGTSCVGLSNGTQATVNLGNYGAEALTVGSIATTGDFSQTNDCPGPLVAGAQCVITVTFSPTTIGTRSGTMTLTGGGLTQTMSLSGTGYAAQVGASPGSLGFGVQAVGTSSAPQTVTVTNTGNFTLSFSSIAAQGPFTQTNNCGGGVNPNNTCAIQVTFTPTATGQQTGTLTLVSNALNSNVSIPLEGGVNADFSLGPPQGGTTSQTVTAGQTASYSLSLASVGGFSGSVSLSCSGAPTGASCSVSPASANLSGNSAVTIMVSVATTARSVVGGPAVFGPRDGLPVGGPGWIWLLGIGAVLAWLWLVARGRRAMAVRVLWAAALLMAVVGVGCGGGSSSGGGSGGTPAGTYTIAVKASSGSTTRTENLTLVVQ